MTADGVYRGSYYFLFNNRDVTQYKVDASAFFHDRLDLERAQVRRQPAADRDHLDLRTTSGNFWVYDCALIGCDGDEPGPTPGRSTSGATRNSIDEGDYNAAWLQDTMTWAT